MIWLLVVVALIVAFFIFAVWISDAPAPYAELDKLIEKNYKESIDFSLAAKGYPVVNDMDIQYSEYLARHPERIKL